MMAKKSSNHRNLHRSPENLYQRRRLQQVAKSNQCEETLRQGFARTKIAAVGPVVARAIEEAGGHVSVVPSDNFHMKPMVREIVADLS
jgi:uroporphyrinogen-III synthase